MKTIRGVVSVVVGFMAGGLCVLAVLGAPAGAQSSGGHFWRDNQPVSSKEAAVAETLPSLSGLVKAVGPSVVNIFTTQKIHNPHMGMGMPNMGPFGFQFPGQGQQQGPGQDDEEDSTPVPNDENTIDAHALGSGFIVSPDGYIVTNNHVVAKADEIKVRLSDGREFPAKVIGRDPQVDVGLIKIEASGLPVVSLGDSDKMLTGDWVLAVGNPLGLDHSASLGIISGKGREIGIGRYDALIQTDAAINPGNSGGPLFNLKGEVVGINTAIVERANSIGFAIPVNMAKEVLPDLKEHGKAIRGQLGVLLRELDTDTEQALKLSSTDGALVEKVLAGSPADRAGLKPGDVITRFESSPVKDRKELQRDVARTRPGDEIHLTYVRAGKENQATARVVEFKEDAVAMAGGAGPGEEGLEPGRLGISVSEATPELMSKYKLKGPEGVVVRHVKHGSVADQAGIEEGDVIREANSVAVSSPTQFKELLKSSQGKPIALGIDRGGERIFLVVKPVRS
jgi:serine protease Do